MKKYTIRSLSSLILIGMSIFSCSKSLDNSEETLPQKKVNANIPAYFASSKVVADGGAATFSTSEKVYVYNDATSTLDTEYLSPDADGATANLKGSLAGTYSKGDNLKLLYNTTSEGIADYTNQDGTLENVVDAATATVKISSVDGDSFTTRTAYFENLQSIFKFTFKEGEKVLKVKDIIIGSSDNKLLQRFDVISDEPTYGSLRLSNSTALSTIYVALRFSRNPSDRIGFTVIDENGIVYTGSKTAPTSGFKVGRFYNSTISVSRMSEGKLNRKFSVSDEKTVYFAWGNYKYKDGKYFISSTQYDNDHYYVSSFLNSNMAVREIYYDDEHISTGWYVLSRDEWNYLVKTRNMNEGVERWYRITTNATTGNVFGLLLPPDDALAWEVTDLSDLATNIDIEKFTNLSYVFLPAAGFKGDSGVQYQERGYYWSSTGSYKLNFYEKTTPNADAYGGTSKYLIRLVHD